MVRADSLSLLDGLYPRRCPGCRGFSLDGFCELCRSVLPEIRGIACRRCGAPIEEEACLHCFGASWAFDTARAPYEHEGPARRAVLMLKYDRWQRASIPLGRAMAEAHKGRWGAPMNYVDAIVPIPIHPKRFRDRGFNQAVLLAREVSDGIGTPIMESAVRIRHTPAQARISAAERWRNLQDAFQVPDRASVEGARLLLIDDVLTSGSTAHHCAEALKGAGAREVSVLTATRELAKDVGNLSPVDAV